MSDAANAALAEPWKDLWSGRPAERPDEEDES